MNILLFFVKKAFSLLVSLLFAFGVELPAGNPSVIYVDAFLGSDSASGSFVSPVKTINRALSLITDEKKTVKIAAGVYPETVEITDGGITLEGEEGTVINSGERISGWEKYKGFIYKAHVEGPVESVFADGSQMLLARWPNTRVDNLCKMKRAQADEGTDSYKVVDSALPKKDLTGAMLTICSGAGWLTFFREITSCEAGKSFSWDEAVKSPNEENPEGMDCYVPEKGNYYYVSGLLSLLDAPGEWYFDEESSVLYFYAPCGQNPDKLDVSVKRRDYGIRINGANDVTVRNIDVFGCGVECASDNCTLDSVNVKCAEFFINSNSFDRYNHCHNNISGNGNTWKNSEISDTWGDGINISGENNTVENCHIHDVDYAAAYYAGIYTTGAGTVIRNCTLHDTGRFNVCHSGAKQLKMTGCEIYNSALLTKDCGSVYSWGTAGEGTEIAFNYVHDNREVGVYIDNNCSGYYVHDNVIIKNGIGITLNSQCLDTVVENNYLLKNERTSSTYYYEKDGPSMAGTVIKGNVYTGKWSLVEGENAPLFIDNKEVKTAVGVKLPEREYGCNF